MFLGEFTGYFQGGASLVPLQCDIDTGRWRWPTVATQQGRYNSLAHVADCGSLRCAFANREEQAHYRIGGSEAGQHLCADLTWWVTGFSFSK